jgi:hypothetical protein
MGNVDHGFQVIDYILNLFGGEQAEARKRYREFVQEGIADGRLPELIGGGLIPINILLPHHANPAFRMLGIGNKSQAHK